jgi:hypothetical protein
LLKPKNENTEYIQSKSKKEIQRKKEEKSKFTNLIFSSTIINVASSSSASGPAPDGW